MKARRSYEMRSRAVSTQATRERILGAMLDLYRRRWYDEITLADVAELAGVALQTVLNHFSTKEGLLSALLDDPRFLQEFAGERFRAKPGDARTALGYLVADYERAGDAMVRLLALEPRAPSIHPHLAMGRIGHRLWLESMFAGDLDDLGREDRERRLSMLICVTDVYAWKILRRDQGLTRDETLSRMLDMVAAVLHAGGRR